MVVVAWLRGDGRGVVRRREVRALRREERGGEGRGGIFAVGCWGAGTAGVIKELLAITRYGGGGVARQFQKAAGSSSG